MSKEAYNHFRELIQENIRDDKNIELQKGLNYYINNNLEEISSGFVLSRLEKNIARKVNKHREIISFFVSTDELIKAISAPSLTTAVREKINSNLKKMIANLSILNEETYLNNKLFKVDIPLGIFSTTINNFFFYFDYYDNALLDGYMDIYKSLLLPEIGKFYHKPSINRQINTKNFQICSPENFLKENVLRKPDIYNVKKLIESFLASVKDRRKILNYEDIIFINKVKVVQTAVFLQNKDEKPVIEEAVPNISSMEVIRESEEKVRKLIFNVLKGSIKQKEYAGFFIKEDYIEWIAKKHSDVPIERVETIFDNITTPKPPIGVTRFIIPQTQEHKQLVYFIALDHVPIVFDKLRARKKKPFDLSSHISERHYFLFLKKLINDFSKVGYTSSKIASILNCNSNVIDSMKEFIKNY